MILSTNIILDRLKDYANPYGKMGRLVKEGKLIPLTKGLYEDNLNASGVYLANAIYGPSYISFNYALSYYGLIPGAVYDFTSATTEKKKKKSFTNRFGTFTYRDVPVEIYPYPSAHSSRHNHAPEINNDFLGQQQAYHQRHDYHN